VEILVIELAVKMHFVMWEIIKQFALVQLVIWDHHSHNVQEFTIQFKDQNAHMIVNVPTTKLALINDVKIHASHHQMFVHKMQNVEFHIIDQHAHVDRDSLEMLNSLVMNLDVDRIVNVRQLKLVWIVNVQIHADTHNVEEMQSANRTTITNHVVTASKDIAEIHWFHAKDLNARRTMIVLTSWLARMKNVSIHVNVHHQHNVQLEIMCHHVNVQQDTLETHNNLVQLFQFNKIHNADKMLIVQVNMLASTVSVRILAMKPNLARQMQSVQSSILFPWEQWFVHALKDTSVMLKKNVDQVRNHVHQTRFSINIIKNQIFF
jgi:hypothetical protein